MLWNGSCCGSMGGVWLVSDGCVGLVLEGVVEALGGCCGLPVGVFGYGGCGGLMDVYVCGLCM